MSDAAKPESPVTAPSPPTPTSIARFPGAESDAALGGAPRDRGDDAVYRPLSGLTIAAFGIAAVYSAIIVIGAVVAAIQKMPLISIGWTLVFPVTAVVLAVIGWMQIQMSEGTRTGKRLAVWAIASSIVVSLGYWSYYAATYLVIRRDAEKFARQYFEKIKEGKLESAFLLAVPPKQRPPEDASLREAIENRLNVDPGQGRPGGAYFNLFKENLFTHVILQGGPNARIEPLGVSSWEFTGGGQGYVVRERFRVSSPEMSYEGMVILKSTEPHGKELKGRQWHVALNEMPSEMTGLSPSYEGRNLLTLQGRAGIFLANWCNRLVSKQESDHVDCFLATLDPAKRESCRKSLSSAAGVMAAAGSGEAWNCLATECAATLTTKERLPGYAAFARGELVQLHPEFWAGSDELRGKALPACRDVFRLMAGMPMGHLQGDPNKLGYWSLDQDHIRIRRGVQFQLLAMAETVEGEFLVECPASTTGDKVTPDTWRIVGINLTNVRVTPMGQPPAGRQPAFGGMGVD
jgi:hypothetical protein